MPVLIKLIPLQPATGERKEGKIEKRSGEIYYQINFETEKRLLPLQSQKKGARNLKGFWNRKGA